MRQPLFQRIVSLVLSLGMLASLMPFGPEALVREQWAAWVAAVAPAQDDAALPVATPDGFASPVEPGPAFIPATMPAPAPTSGTTWAGVVAPAPVVPAAAFVSALRAPSPTARCRPDVGAAIAPRAP